MYSAERDVSAKFLARAEDWISVTGEVLIILRYLHGAGSRDFAFCRSRAELDALVNEVPIRTDIMVFRDPQLPIRGVVTNDLIDVAERAIAGCREYLLVSLATTPGSCICAFGGDDEPHHLRGAMAEFLGDEVAVGICPDYTVDDHEGLMSAAKGGIDGPR